MATNITPEQHKTFFGKIFAWIGKVFSAPDLLKAAISITEIVKNFVQSQVVTGLADLVDSAFHTTLGATVLADVNKVINTTLASELALEGFPNGGTEEQIAAWEQNIIKAVTGLDPTKQSKLYTTLAAQVYLILKPEIAAGNITWATIIKDIEQTYQDYLADQAAAA